jgi:aspartyl-tRNA synthetase
MIRGYHPHKKKTNQKGFLPILEKPIPTASPLHKPLLFQYCVVIMDTMLRTTNCGALRGSDADQLTTLNGWVHRIRNHGGITFISLRDRYGITQVVVDEGAPESLTSLAESLRMEFCIAVQGLVRKRPDDMINQGMATGEIEVLAQEISILSKAPVLPFTIEEENQATENTRLEYRFLDLRSPGIQNRLILRHKVAQATRDYLNNRDFLEIETPP